MSHFSVKFVKGEKKGVVISVSKKISKKAVTRNTIKRRVRAVLRDLEKKQELTSFLIIARPGAENIKGDELKKELKALLGL
ncbi:MAG: ribonuclease P protein component [Candidatus Zambryskibacteria bacterium RIFCSPHIGHO2_12_FULL_48_10]|uniref:Ribonuclease P protein component n=1 Tax=Candidatus Zambryskibacteria bacterium RIFCSPHIGHO2_01_FULL_46_25 TaxID=1802738 RepID=A0A1G2SYI1_9BACT|nr:MAG: Ribonuclease P protein component [Parcubacteria group bacterium GW2011_GWA1_47_10]OHA90045.1 MAG: ribonuclease P protein component [Candidatus Zambryskibacteria bacterium RIFCSPHIGHO2_01_FULL_46_25]OHB00713.1 MAG: ribonuclease P protein component [Candidatus Zambryskibacteria bacterium RIFCSPHIGHO2_12_FULL_48_10]OHB06580.1 MAG: ribonuclease P protein component [Candidatus Zambryskibacteria bacterium RIFCSPLOWO2_01_FULL_48_25]